MSKRNYKKPESKISTEKKENQNLKKEETESKSNAYWDKKYEKEAEFFKSQHTK